MEITLAENVRKLRKERRLTQEQLAEVLGVTTGAVYKWESGMSVPDISLIMEMADFFDTSVDVLLGYKSKDNRLEAAVCRIEEMLRTRNPEALTEAEKLLKKYPNNFIAVHSSAATYSFFGVGSGNEANSRRSLELFEQSRLLINQNTDPRVSDETILAEIAAEYESLHEYDKAVEIMKKHNPSGMNSGSIGVILAMDKKNYEEAKPYLLEGILHGLFVLVNSVMGQAMILCGEKKYENAQNILNFGRNMIRGIRKGDSPDFTDKLSAMTLALLSYTYLETGNRAECLATLDKTAEYVRRFDASPDYGLSELIVEVSGPVLVHDTLGDSARESVEEVLKCLEDPEILKLWDDAVRRSDVATSGKAANE